MGFHEALIHRALFPMLGVCWGGVWLIWPFKAEAVMKCHFFFFWGGGGGPCIKFQKKHNFSYYMAGYGACSSRFFTCKYYIYI